MAGRTSQLEQVAAISRVAQVAPHASAFRGHLADILGNPAFKGSRRSQEFLHHIVEKALQGHFDELKERSVGVELFGRPATYDTGEDAIVRVTASDVRKRLLQFYSDSGMESELRIDLPAGSYIPEFRQIPRAEERPAPVTPMPEEPVVLAPVPAPGKARSSRGLLIATLAFLLGASTVWGFRSLWNLRSSSSLYNVAPWATLLRPDRPLRLVFCDPDISRVQGMLNFRVSLSDYANHRYLPEPNSISPDLRKSIQSMRGVNVAAVDAAIALNISELTLRNSHRVRTYTARSMQLTDFKTDDNFILLGSPRSNPWFTLFDDKLDFKFEYDGALGQEVIRNSRVRSGDSSRYVPTAQGWDTGQAYAIVAFIGNPGQSGHVLLLAGSNAEATEAAGKFVTNLDQLARVLKDHNINPAGPPVDFEILLKVASMAGSSNTFEVIAVHRLSASS